MNLRRWAYDNLFIGSLENIARGLRHWPSFKPERNGLEVHRDISYLDGDDPNHTLDIYKPADAEGPLPVVFYVHGGGFQFFDKDTHWAMGATFAREGYLAICINYRLAPTHPYPAAFEDAAAALLWILEHAPRYGGDLDRMVWAGESAGGNLVLSLALASCWPHDPSDVPWARMIYDAAPRPRVLLPACGYLQVANPQRLYEGKNMPGWIVDRINVVSDAYLPDHAEPKPSHAFANPIITLEAAEPPTRPFPATFALIGTRDPVLPDTIRLDKALERLAITRQVEVYKGGIHAFHAMKWKPLAKQAWSDQLAFVREHLDPAADAAA